MTKVICFRERGRQGFEVEFNSPTRVTGGLYEVTEENGKKLGHNATLKISARSGREILIREGRSAQVQIEEGRQVVVFEHTSVASERQNS